MKIKKKKKEAANIKQQLKTKIMETVLSPDAIQWVYDHGYPMASRDFIGWAFPATETMNGVLSLDGKWGLYSVNIDENGIAKPLDQEEFIDFTTQLLATGFLVFQEQSPFPEFEYYNNIKFDISRAQYYDGVLFEQSEEEK